METLLRDDKESWKRLVSKETRIHIPAKRLPAVERKLTEASLLSPRMGALLVAPALPSIPSGRARKSANQN